MHSVLTHIHFRESACVTHYIVIFKIQFQNQRTVNNDQIEKLKQQEEKVQKEMMMASMNDLKQDLQQLTRKTDMSAAKKCPEQKEVINIDSLGIYILNKNGEDVLGFFYRYQTNENKSTNPLQKPACQSVDRKYFKIRF